MIFILMLPRIIALLTGFISASVKSDRYKLFCHIARKKEHVYFTACGNLVCGIYILVQLVAASLLSLCCTMSQERNYMAVISIWVICLQGIKYHPEGLTPPPYHLKQAQEQEHLLHVALFD